MRKKSANLLLVSRDPGGLPVWVGFFESLVALIFLAALACIVVAAISGRSQENAYTSLVVAEKIVTITSGETFRRPVYVLISSNGATAEVSLERYAVARVGSEFRAQWTGGGARVIPHGPAKAERE